METNTKATVLNTKYLEGEIPRPDYDMARDVGERKEDIWTATVSFNGQSWTGPGCSNQKKARESAAAKALSTISFYQTISGVKRTMSSLAGHDSHENKARRLSITVHRDGHDHGVQERTTPVKAVPIAPVWNGKPR